MMGAMPIPDTDHAVARLLRQQHGVLSRRQALAAGMTEKGLAVAIRRGRLLRLAPAVYAESSHPPTWHRQLMAAVLVHEGNAAVTGAAAAALYGFDGFHAVRPQLLVPHSVGAANPLARLFRTRHFAGTDLTRVAGIPVVTPARMVVELAGTRDAAELGRLIDQAVLRKKLDPEVLLGRTAELLRGRRPGRAVMQDVLEDRLCGYVPAESELEAVMFETMDAAGYRHYLRQFKLPWRRGSRPAGTVDALFPLERVVAEGDGRSWHVRLERWEQDRRRDLDLLAHGFVPIRATWRALTVEPQLFLAALGEWLEPPLEINGHWAS
jgi:hypothetical protein